MKGLEDNGLSNNTLVFMTSDNGPQAEGSAGPFKGAKHDVWEGGVRNPGVFRWSEKIPAGQKIDRLLGVEDV